MIIGFRVPPKCDATCFVHWNGVLPACAPPIEKCGNVFGPPHSSMWGSYSVAAATPL